jgi:hypothetical protein
MGSGSFRNLCRKVRRLGLADSDAIFSIILYLGTRTICISLALG